MQTITALMALIFIWGCHPSTAVASTASWYSEGYNAPDPWKHTTTASGEAFNDQALTAASYRFNMGSKVKVTNLANGRHVMVTINDRGPSKALRTKGRDLDLSKGAFAKIADLKTGVIHVKEEQL